MVILVNSKECHKILTEIYFLQSLLKSIISLTTYPHEVFTFLPIHRALNIHTIYNDIYKVPLILIFFINPFIKIISIIIKFIHF